MSIGLLAALIGALGGLAIVAGLVAIVPAAPVDLVAAIARIDDAATSPGRPVGRWGWWGRMVDRLAEQSRQSTNRWWGAPVVDLDLLGRTVTGYITARLVWACLGFVVFGLLAVAVDLEVLLVLSLALVGATAGSVVPAARVRRQATAARVEFTDAVTAFYDLVAQERASGAAATQAMSEAAAVAQGWVFIRIRAALANALPAGISSWDALTQLGQRFGIVALVDLAAIVSSAADGAAVYATLTKKAASLRNTALNHDKEIANRRSEKLVGPMACLLAGFVILIVYPMFATL